jgi:hypothetical protein
MIFILVACSSIILQAHGLHEALSTRAHTPVCCCSASTWYSCACWRSLHTFNSRLYIPLYAAAVHLLGTCTCVLVDNLYLHSILGCTHEQKAHGGAVDRCGQQNTGFVTPYPTIRSIMKQVFRRFRQIGCAYVLHRCLDLEIWRFLCWRQTDRQTDIQAYRQTDGQTDCFIPCCACARGVITSVIQGLQA